MITSLVSMYKEGVITSDHLVAECLLMIDLDDPGLVLGDLPITILDRMLAYIRAYQPGRMISTYKVLPATDQIEAARDWIEDFQMTKEDGETSPEDQGREVRAD